VEDVFDALKERGTHSRSDALCVYGEPRQR
jgi:hypothetical protein